MNTDWFDGWVELHCEATAAGVDAARALLANRSLILGAAWHANQSELGEVTARLVAGCRVPKFANEHTDAIGKELVRLREERSHDNRAAPAGDFAADCPACGGSGLAVIPVRSCVWDRRLVLQHGRIITGAVLCDRPGCEAGRITREKETALADGRRRPTLSACERLMGCDLVALLREYERDMAAKARRGLGDTGTFPALQAILDNARRREPRSDAA